MKIILGPYRRAHDRAPRGKGTWIFTSPGPHHRLVHTGHYADGKRRAIAWMHPAPITLEP